MSLSLAVRSTARGCFAALAITLAATAFAQEDEASDKPPTLAEAKAAFAKADRELNQMWSAAKAAVTGSALDDLTQSQRDWLTYRDERAKQASEEAGESDPKRSATWHAIAADLTESRSRWLRARTRAAKEPPTELSGFWIDGYGGVLRIAHLPGKKGESVEDGPGQLFFDIEVVRGPTFHTGNVAGIAAWNYRIGWWSDKGAPDRTQEANLAFIDRDSCLEVIGAKTDEYHGARASFDGIYCKVQSLDASERAEVIKNAESGGERDESGDDSG